METQNKYKQAFPTENSSDYKGLTKLEYVTTMVMQGILSNEGFNGQSMHPALNVPLAVEVATEILNKCQQVSV